MGGILFPLLVFAFFAGLIATERAQTELSVQSKAEIVAKSDGTQFLAYRDGVAAYVNVNPAFIGTVPSTSIIALGNQFSTSFLTSSNNLVTQVGTGTGRVITVYSLLSPGAAAAASMASSNDASIGTSTGLNWVSAAQGVSYIPQTLLTTVPNGSVVSVIQKGP